MLWGTLDAAGWIIALAVGLFTGVVSGLMGIGGGNVMVPASTIRAPTQTVRTIPSEPIRIIDG